MDNQQNFICMLLDCIICDNNYNEYSIDYSIDNELNIELINHD